MKRLFYLIPLALFLILASACEMPEEDNPLDPILHIDGDVWGFMNNLQNYQQAGVRLAPGDYEGRKIVRVDYYLQNSPTYLALYIYGTTPPDIYPSSNLYTQECSSKGAGQWNSVWLTTPVTIPGTDFWIALYAETGNQAVFCVDVSSDYTDRNFMRVSAALPLPVPWTWTAITWDLNIRAYTEE